MLNDKSFSDVNTNLETPNSNITTEKHLNEKKKISKRVDINTLLNKVRANQKKEKLESTIFFSLVAAIIVVTGIIISI